VRAGAARAPNGAEPHSRPAVNQMLDLAHALLADNAEHVVACCRIDTAS
jgi:hypothetical protein